MKKKVNFLSVVIRFSATAFLVAAIAALVACGSSGGGSGSQRDDSYIVAVNAGLVSFTDCANGFCDELDKMAQSSLAPSDATIISVEQAFSRLEASCAGLEGLEAPPEYAAAQEKLNAAMADYRTAFEKYRALMDFYKTYDEQFRKYKSPVTGSAEMAQKGRALYAEFAAAMEQATNSFSEAVQAYDSVG